MKSYIDLCKVPLVDLGCRLVQKLIQGIHPFDGMSYISEERDRYYRRKSLDVRRTAEILRYAIFEAGIPVPQVDQDIPDLDRLHLSALTILM